MIKSGLISISILFAISSKALACSYPYPGDAVEMIEKADVVFAGIVEKVVTLDSSGRDIRKTVNGIVFTEKGAWRPYASVRVKPVKLFKGYVGDPVVVYHDVQCDGDYWFKEIGKMRVIVGNYDGSESRIQMVLGNRPGRQKEIIDYLEKGIEPKVEHFNFD